MRQGIGLTPYPPLKPIPAAAALATRHLQDGDTEDEMNKMPSEYGYYWLQLPSQALAAIVWVDDDGDVYQIGDNRYCPAMNFRGAQWSGPIKFDGFGDNDD